MWCEERFEYLQLLLLPPELKNNYHSNHEQSINMRICLTVGDPYGLFILALAGPLNQFVVREVSICVVWTCSAQWRCHAGGEVVFWWCIQGLSAVLWQCRSISAVCRDPELPTFFTRCVWTLKNAQKCETPGTGTCSCSLSFGIAQRCVGRPASLSWISPPVNSSPFLVSLVWTGMVSFMILLWIGTVSGLNLEVSRGKWIWLKGWGWVELDQFQKLCSSVNRWKCSPFSSWLIDYYELISHRSSSSCCQLIN